MSIKLKSSALSKNSFLCEVQDTDLSFSGDMGAIGRINCSGNDLFLDLKGKKYSGTLLPGPTVVVLNPCMVNEKMEFRVEFATNEFCRLDHVKDSYFNSSGIISGEDISDHDDSPVQKKKQRSSEVHSNFVEALAISSSDEDSHSLKRKISRPVKISTITQRKAGRNTKDSKKKRSMPKV